MLASIVVLGCGVYQVYTCIIMQLILISPEDVSIPDGVTFTVDSDLNGDSPQFTLTCISTGGPATTVTWTRDSVEASGERMSVLTDPVTAQYTHTLTVNGRLEGQYKCTVSNNKPSTATAVLGNSIKWCYYRQHKLTGLIR